MAVVCYEESGHWFTHRSQGAPLSYLPRLSPAADILLAMRAFISSYCFSPC